MSKGPLDDSVVVVGASAAGTAAALNLRRLGHTGPITLVGDEEVLPYDRPPLSKGVLLGAQTIDEIGLATSVQLKESGISVRLGVRALGLDAAARRLELSDGESCEYDRLVIATGASPRRLPALERLVNCHHLRTAGDAEGLRRALVPGRRLGVVGSGLIGLEVAASARSCGLDVVVVDPAELPLADRLTAPVASWLLGQHRLRGVDLRLGRDLVDVVIKGGAAEALRLDDGSEIPVDEVLVAVGAAPNVDWLADSGLTIDQGVVCDEFQRADDEVYVVGDVANGFHPVLERSLRMETRTNATDGALHVAQTLVGGQEAYAPVPFFWTDQYDFKIQSFGLPGRCDDIEFVDGNLDEDRWIAVCRDRERLTAVIARATGKPVLVWRRQLQDVYQSLLDNREKVAVIP